MMRTVHLHGEAGKLFGRKWELDVETLAEAVHAIGVQIEGFRQYIESRNWQCVRGKTRTKGMPLGEDMVLLRLGNADLHIMPVMIGAGGKMGGVGKIIAGVLLAGFAFFAAPAMGLSSFAGMSLKSVGMLGVGLALSGVSSLLAPQQKKEKDDSSKLFQNAPDTASQGSPVPILVGEFRMTNVPIISNQIITSKAT